MSLFYNSLDSITEQDLDSLIQNKVSESRNIEYKEALPEGEKQAKVKILAAIASFANTDGGDLILGIREGRPKGLPVELCGVDVSSPDDVERTILSTIRDNITPRIPNVKVKFVPLSNGHSAVIVRVARSWVGPHMVTFDGMARFYGRNAKGNYPMDYQEIRQAFMSAGLALSQLEEFRAKRLNKISANNTPVEMKSSAKIIVHLIPQSAFVLGVKYDLDTLVENQRYPKPIYRYYNNTKRNFDGLLSWYNSEAQNKSYAQLYTNGIVELVDSYYLGSSFLGNNIGIPSEYEYYVVKSIKDCLGLHNLLGVQAPVYVLLSIIGVKDFILSDAEQTYLNRNRKIDRDELVVPELVLEESILDERQIALKMKSAFDSIWFAADWSGSVNYSNGVWKPKGSLQN